MHNQLQVKLADDVSDLGSDQNNGTAFLGTSTLHHIKIMSKNCRPHPPWIIVGETTL